ncbi:MAG: hypothetical protein ABJB34_06735 [Acidobacteriota bacterium]
MNTKTKRISWSTIFLNGMLCIVALFCAAVSVPAAGPGASTASLSPSDDPILLQELARVRRATARYHDISQAIADDYVDIGLFVSGQGFHYLKPTVLDGTFDLEKPEILVYAPNPTGDRLRLVAVEYAVPVLLSPSAPEGFTGATDLWEVNTEFGLWVLHAWVWQANPNGMFADSNPRVP